MKIFSFVFSVFIFFAFIAIPVSLFAATDCAALSQKITTAEKQIANNSQEIAVKIDELKKALQAKGPSSVWGPLVDELFYIYNKQKTLVDQIASDKDVYSRECGASQTSSGVCKDVKPKKNSETDQWEISPQSGSFKGKKISLVKGKAYVCDGSGCSLVADADLPALADCIKKLQSCGVQMPSPTPPTGSNISVAVKLPGPVSLLACLKPATQPTNPKPIPKRENYVVVEYTYLPGCSPCRDMAPLVNKLKKEGLPISVIKLDGITRPIPAFILIINGEQIGDEKRGILTEETLRSMAKQAEEAYKKALLEYEASIK